MEPTLGGEGYVLVFRAVGKGQRAGLVGAARVRVAALGPLAVEVLAGSGIPAGTRLLVLPPPEQRRRTAWFAGALTDAGTFRGTVARYWTSPARCGEREE